MKRHLLAFLALVGLLAGPGPLHPTALADEVGRVSVSSGAASIISCEGQERAASVRMGVDRQDTLATGADGMLQIVLQDETMLALGADSRLVVLDTMDKDGGDLLHLDLVQGALRVLTSPVVASHPDQFRIDSPLGLIGVRGTEFGVRVLPERSTVLLYEGGPVLFTPAAQGPEAEAARADACAKLDAALKDAQTTLQSSKERMNPSIGSKMKRRIDEIETLRAEARCTP
jgi:hypothetical protein